MIFQRGDAETGGGIALGIKVDQQGLFAGQGEACGKVNCSGGFADSTFLVCDAEDSRHRSADLFLTQSPATVVFRDIGGAFLAIGFALDCLTPKRMAGFSACRLQVSSKEGV